MINNKYANVDVIGDGINGLACVGALHKLGIPCRWLIDRDSTAGFSPQLVLNDVALSLLNDLFPGVDLTLGHELDQRVVAWENPNPDTIKQQSLSIHQGQLRQILSDYLAEQGIRPQRVDVEQMPQPGKWQIWTQRKPLASFLDKAQINRHRLTSGVRKIHAASVKLSHHCQKSSYVVESADDGWMILIPHNLQQGTLQWCSPATTEPEDWLEQSKVIAPQISGLNDERCFNVAPTIALPMCGQTDDGCWIIAGEQAANLDPISGEGTPFSLRSAILAAAAIEAIRDNRIDASDALLHYQSRLTKTFIEHLKGCLSYYHDTFGHHPNWQEELARTQFLIEQLERVTQPDQWIEKYKIVDGRLVNEN